MAWWDSILDYLHERHGLAWLGIILSIATLGAPGLVFFSVLAGKIVAILGWVLAAAFAYPLIMRREPVLARCLKCDKRYELKGSRGENGTLREIMHLRACRDLPEAIPLMRGVRSDGKILSDRWYFKKLPDGKDSDPTDNGYEVRAPFRERDPQYPGDSLMLARPEKVPKGCHFRITRTAHFEGAFPRDAEQVGKRIMFPTDELLLQVVFEGSTISEVVAKTFARSAAAESVRKLPVKPNGAQSVVDCEVRGARVGELYAVRWTWGSVSSSV